MANRDIITRAGKGVPITATEHDKNINSWNTTVEVVSTATRTVVYTDQNKILELNNAAMVVTLDLIATIAAAIDTGSFKVTLRNINAAAATVNVTGPDTMDADANNNTTSMTLSQYQVVTFETDGAGTKWMKLSSGASFGPTIPLEVYNAIVINDLTVSGDTILGNAPGDTLTVTGTSTFNGDVTVDGALTVTGNLDFIDPSTENNAVVQNAAGSVKDAGYKLTIVTEFLSGPISIVQGGTSGPMVHGLGGLPSWWSAWLECVVDDTANSGLTVGDFVPYKSGGSFNNQSSDANPAGLQVVFTASSANVRFANKTEILSLLKQSDGSKADIGSTSPESSFRLHVNAWRIETLFP